MNILTYPNRLSKSRIVIHTEAQGDPLSKQRPRFAMNKGGGVYAPKQTKEAEEFIGWVVKLSKPSLFCDKENLFGVRLIFHQANCQRRDIDNMVKLVLDGCTGVVWEDDSQVVEMNAYKFVNVGTENAKTEICIYKAGTLSGEFITCEVCGKRVRSHPSWVSRKFCSKRCSSISQHKYSTRTCVYCGKGFSFPSREESFRKFCTPNCRKLYQSRSHVTKHCLNCNKELILPPYKSNRKRGKYCSTECRIEYTKGKGNKTPKGEQGVCAQCGKPTSKKSYKRCISCYLSGRYGTVDRKDPRTEIEIIPGGGT